ncbi:protein phosphatase CheZ [Magnetospirillum fulvum]|uniref:Chemotaxis protein CheZ n=1 Tax=Magnetospirillum fulvum TaxID=1082 RepID=A0A1H6IHM1_MAGFU|nr:protein phosphatase CheZ [Magnetospirillum fulvum]SEH48445.1 chemotaxis protein CheZ [Magnetospirillum fulvum]
MANAKGSADAAGLKRELVGLFGHLQKIRADLAALNPPGSSDHFNSMSEQLDAIVAATETATNTIMESVEEIDGLMTEARVLVADAQSPRLEQIFDSVGDRVNQVFEACSFQDITGQRVSKVVNSLKFVEDRVNSIILTWGREELAKVVVEIKQEEDPDRKLLHGPQLPNEAMGQADVDALLGQDAIDKLFG